MKNKPHFKVIINNNNGINDSLPSIYKYNSVVNKKPKILNTIKARKKNYDWNAIMFPVFTYKKLNKFLKVEIHNIFLILEHMNNLQNSIIETQQKMQSAGLALNLFINNSFKNVNFNYQQQFIIIRNDKLEVHDNVALDTALVYNEIHFLHYEDDELLNLIPAQKDAPTISEAQQKLFNELFNNFIKYNEYVDDLNDDYEHAFEIYEHLLTSLKIELPNASIVNLTTNDKPEVFNDFNHDVISLNRDESIEIYYVNKENQEEFLDFLMAEKK